MTARLKGRRRHAAQLVGDLTRWAQQEPAVQAVCLVGSYARGAERLASDVDVMVLSADLDAHGPVSGWFQRLRPGSRLLRVATWGPVQEQRWRLRCGLVAEIDLGPVGWAGVPLDGGTRRVLADGHRILHDPRGMLARAVSALDQGTA